MYRPLILCLAVAASTAVPARPAESASLNCLDRDVPMFSCLAVKAARALERAARSSDIKIADGATFVRDTPMNRDGKSLKSETELMEELPRDTAGKAVKLSAMLCDAVNSFFESHSLKLSMPSMAEGRSSESITDKIPNLQEFAGLKLFAFVPIALGALSILVTKALFVGKVALLLAGILAFQKLFGSASTSSFFNKATQPAVNWIEGSSNYAWSPGPTATQTQGYYSRSFTTDKRADPKIDAHSLAYSAQMPTAN